MRLAVAITVGIYTGGWVTQLLPASWGTAAGVIGAAAGGFTSGYISSGGDLQSALYGGLSAGTANYIGHVAQLGDVMRTVAHGVTQGLITDLRGGAFAAGALSAMVGHAVPIEGLSAGIQNEFAQVMVDVSAAAMLGGTVSALTGGKFANGAQTAAFVRLFNSHGKKLWHVSKGLGMKALRFAVLDDLQGCGRGDLLSCASLIPAGKVIKFARLAVKVAKSVIDPKRFNYLFGKSTSNAHNAARSNQLALEMKRLGISDNATGHKILSDHLSSAASQQGNVLRTFSNKHGTFEVRDSLLFGPSGKATRLESTFQVMPDGARRFTTTIPKR